MAHVALLLLLLEKVCAQVTVAAAGRPGRSPWEGIGLLKGTRDCSAGGRV